MCQLIEEVRILKGMEDKMKTPLDHKILKCDTFVFPTCYILFFDDGKSILLHAQIPRRS